LNAELPTPSSWNATWSFPNGKDFIVCDPQSRIIGQREWTQNDKAAGRRLVVELSLCHTERPET
jgi:hypothetical protein